MQISEDAVAFLQEARIPIRLSCLTARDWPLVVSLWYIHLDGRLYCATQQDARIAAHLRRNPRCAFEVAGDDPPYRGVRGQGKARLVPERGEEILEELLLRYLKGLDSPLARRLLARASTETAIEIHPTWIYTWDFSRRMKGSLPDSEGS